jgi:TPR repeat protein
MAHTDNKQLVQLLVGRAVALDNKEGANYEQAAYYYEQAAAAIHRLIAIKVSLPTSWVEKASDYQARASVLRNSCKLKLICKIDCDKKC